MNKSQILILLLIIALVFYYLNEENQPKSSSNNSPDEPWTLIKKPQPKPQAPEPKLTFWPPNNPVVNQSDNFGLNPPHSQLSKPKVNDEPEEIKFPGDVSVPDPEFLTAENSLNETYRQRFLTLLNDFTATSLTLQAIDTLQKKDQPRSVYFSAIWKLKGLTNFQEQMAQPLREWINLTTTFKPTEAPVDYGWLTDDNLEFILNNYQPIQSALAKTKNFHLRTDIANIYNSFQKSLSQQDWDLPEFLQELELTKVQYTLFPLRVNGNHWGLFLLHNLTWQELTPTYQVYYTSSGGMSLESEKQQLQPFINQICGENSEIKIIHPQDRQSKGYECGVYLVFYLQEILETKQLKLSRTYSATECQQFRGEWKERIGTERWCQLI